MACVCVFRSFCVLPTYPGVHACVGVRGQLVGISYSPSKPWVLGIELGSPGLAESAFMG